MGAGAGGLLGSLDGERMFPAPPRPVEYSFAELGAGSRPLESEKSSGPVSGRVREAEVWRMFPRPPLPVEKASRPRDCERS